jgi:AraC-like DNA-binding protein
MVQQPTPFGLLAHPYTRLCPLETAAKDIRALGRKPGSALVWCMGRKGARPESACPSATGGTIAAGDSSARGRTHGFPRPRSRAPAASPQRDFALPSQSLGIRPYTGAPAPPGRPSGRGNRFPPLARPRRGQRHSPSAQPHPGFSAELKSISPVSRGMYLSRRALGRRLTTRGLPVASYWLQIGRLLRVATRLQNNRATMSSVAFEHGYPDAFSLSNQMERLIRHHPTEVRRFLGWEWVVEAWLRREAEFGRLRIGATPHEHIDAEVRPVGIARPSRARRRQGRPHQGPGA